MTAGGTVGGVRLRTMRWWDIPAVHALEQRLFPEDAWSEQLFWSELALARGPGRTRHYVLAGGPGDAPLAGYAGLAAAGDTAEVQTLAVDPARQGTGLGARLLSELLDAATVFGCREVFLEVRHDNDRAQRLYHRYGFSTVGLRRGYYQPGNHDALVMRRDHPVPDPGPDPDPDPDPGPDRGAPDSDPGGPDRSEHPRARGAEQ